MMNPQMRQQMMQRFDKNSNGQLEPDEQQAAQQAMQQMREAEWAARQEPADRGGGPMAGKMQNARQWRDEGQADMPPMLLPRTSRFNCCGSTKTATASLSPTS